MQTHTRNWWMFFKGGTFPTERNKRSRFSAFSDKKDGVWTDAMEGSVCILYQEILISCYWCIFIKRCHYLGRNTSKPLPGKCNFLKSEISFVFAFSPDSKLCSTEIKFASCTRRTYIGKGNKCNWWESVGFDEMRAKRNKRQLRRHIPFAQT